MTTTFRRGGTFVAFAWSGNLVSHDEQGLSDRLATRRFRTIDTACSEEVSAGWVTPEDPSGDSFADEDMDGGTATLLRVRVDVKKLPKAQWQMHLQAATRAKGKPLSARERRELKDDLSEKLLPRVIPSTTNIDALMFHRRRLLLLFAAGKSARETFGKLFFESFGVPLERLGPLQLGLRQLVDDAKCDTLDRLEPTRWPVARRTA